MGWADLVAGTRRAANQMLGGVPVTAGALSGVGLLDMKSQLVMDDAVVSIEYALTVETALFGGLQYGSVLVIDGAGYRVRQEPIRIGDGSDCIVMLEKLPEGAPLFEGSSSAAFSLAASAAGLVLVSGESSYVLVITGIAAGGEPGVISGASSAGLAIGGAAVGSILVLGASSISLPITGAASVGVRISGASSVSLPISGSASAVIGSVATGASSASLAFTGASAGAVWVAGSSILPLAIAGASAGVVPIDGSSAQALLIAGSASGVIGAMLIGSSSVTLPIAGTAAGAVTVAGASSEALAIIGAAEGAVRATGSSSVTLPIAGTAAGAVTVAGASSEALAIIGAAEGAVRATGSSSVTLPIAGTAAGVVAINGASIQALAITGIAAGTVGSGGAPTGPSDDFATGSLNSFWTATLPGSSSYSFGNDGTEYYIDLVMPAGFNYDNYNTTKSTPRILQTVGNGDFTIVLKALSTPTVAYSGQGIFIQGSNSDDWMRFDVFSNGSVITAFAATTVAGVSTNRVNTTVAGGASYLKLTRSGNSWNPFYSSNGSSWSILSSFSHTMTVAQVGFHGISTSAGYTARIDYFEHDSDPLTSEDS